MAPKSKAASALYASHIRNCTPTRQRFFFSPVLAGMDIPGQSRSYTIINAALNVDLYTHLRLAFKMQSYLLGIELPEGAYCQPTPLLPLLPTPPAPCHAWAAVVLQTQRILNTMPGVRQCQGTAADGALYASHIPCPS